MLNKIVSCVLIATLFVNAVLSAAINNSQRQIGEMSPQSSEYQPTSRFLWGAGSGRPYYPNYGGGYYPNHGGGFGMGYPNYGMNGYYPNYGSGGFGTNFIGGFPGGNGGYGGYGGNMGLNSYYGYNSRNYFGNRNVGFGYYSGTDRTGFITPNAVTGHRGYN